MSSTKAYAPGIYARSESLVQATRDLDRDRTTREEVEERRDEDHRNLLEVQRSCGMNYLTDGMLSWQDAMRPLLENSSGVAPGALTRFLETNTFYRAPMYQGIVEREKPLGEEYFRLAAMDSREDWVATLPSPLSFASPDEGITALDAAEEILLPQVEWLTERCCSLIVLHEPNLFGRNAVAKVELLEEALRPLSEAGTPLALWMTFGDAAPVLPELARIDGLYAVGVDFYSTSLESFPDEFPKTLLAGVVDARNSLLEEPEKVADFLQKLAGRVEGEVHIVPNGDLQFVPEVAAREKVRILGESADILRGRLT